MAGIQNRCLERDDIACLQPAQDGMQFRKGFVMKLTTGLLLAAAFTLVTMQGTVSAQSAGAPCNDCQPTSQFGWSGGAQGVASGHGGGHFARAYEQHNLIYQRNQAWPKPFICWDRAAYFNTWNQMYTSGLAGECTLSDAHFDSETGKLNPMGERKIEVIFRNLPETHRGVLIAESRDPNLNNQRLEVARNAVRQWYGEGYASQVALTGRVPEPASGARVYGVNTSYQASLPVPTINNAAGSGSTSGATNNAGGTSGGGN